MIYTFVVIEKQLFVLKPILLLPLPVLVLVHGFLSLSFDAIGSENVTTRERVFVFVDVRDYDFGHQSELLPVVLAERVHVVHDVLQRVQFIVHFPLVLVRGVVFFAQGVQ